jgi:hypothetical protein
MASQIQPAPPGDAPTPPPSSKKPIWERWWFWLAAIVLLLVVVDSVGGGETGDSTNTGAGTAAAVPSTESPVDDNREAVVDPTAVTTATRFVAAYGAFDAAGAMTYLAGDADITNLIESLSGQGAEGTPHEFRQMVSLMEAAGYEQLLDSCEVASTVDSGTNVRCTFDYHFLRSDEIGLGPFSGGTFRLTVRDGEIVDATQYWSGVGEEFSPLVWEPFADWVSHAYPEDAFVMYADQQTAAQLSKESIRLWEQHTKEYAEEVGGATAGQ